MIGVTPLLISAILFLLSSVSESHHTETCKEDDKEPWSYHGQKNGPTAWGESFPDCYGKKQSPIAIKSSTTVKDSNLALIKMENYDKPVSKANIVNNGHSVQITPQDGVERSIQAEGKKFVFQQLHFHWGGHWDIGSEHTLDGRRYSLEAHFVHKSADGALAVVGVFFQEVLLNNRAFSPIIDTLRKINYRGQSTDLTTALDMNALLPKNPASFYRYSGSLTTPGCSENVIWSVLKGVRNLGTFQLQKLRHLHSVEEGKSPKGCHLVNNYRPVQPLNTREVRTPA